MSKPPTWSPTWQRFLWLLLAIVLFALTSYAVWLIPFAIGMKGQATSPLALAIVVPAAVLFGLLYALAATRVTNGGLRQRVGGLAVAQIAIFLAAFLIGPILLGARPAAKKVHCMSNTKTLALGVLMYSADNDERLPPSDQWRTLAGQKYKDESLTCLEAEGEWHYGFNADLADTKEADIEYPLETVMVFEMDGKSFNAAGGPADVVYRHHGQTAVTFADGHAKAGKEDVIAGFRWKLR